MTRKERVIRTIKRQDIDYLPSNIYFAKHKTKVALKDALKLASNHDPELVKWLRGIDRRLVLVQKALNTIESNAQLTERRLDRVGAPQYRTLYSPSPKIQTVEANTFAIPIAKKEKN